MKIESNNSGSVGKKLGRYLSPLSAWALAFGAAVGWGAFMMPGTTFLPVAGPLGTALGIGIGALVMLVIGINYSVLMKRYPDAGGAYTYVKRICNYDHGYLCAWFLILAYVAIAWANATALAVISRTLFSGVFSVGAHYAIAGYDVYLGEVALSVFALLTIGALLLPAKRLAARVQSVLAIILIGGIAVAFAGALWKAGGVDALVTPAFAPGGGRAFQVISIVALAPWAFVGFESISHSVEEFRFPSRYLYWVLFSVIVTAAFSYIALTFVATSVQPGNCESWLCYVNRLGKYTGLESMPVFYAVKATLGKAGFVLLCLAAFAAMITGLIAHLLAASRLVYSLARDGLLPRWFGKVSESGSPRNTITFLVASSCLVPLLGRTAIGWIVDVTTIGACIAYGYVSYCAFKVAKNSNRIFVAATGVVGIAVSLAFIVYFLVPNFWTVGAFAEESYFILAGWCILGFICFRGIFSRDREHRLGKSTVVWLALLFLIFFASHMWVRQATHRVTSSVVANISDHYQTEFDRTGKLAHEDDDEYLVGQQAVIDDALTFDNIMQMSLVVLSLGIMFSIYSTMARREREAAKAKEYFFSTVSHDIRTPLNAIIGYSQMLKLGFDSKEEQRQAIDSILISSDTLLRLINDILDLSALEAGKMSIDPEPTDCVRLINDIVTSFHVAAHKHDVELRTKIEQMPLLLIDPFRLRQIAFNLIGNGIKFTEKGHIEIRAYFTPEKDVALGTFHFEVEDTGVGISEEDQAKIASPYVQLGSKLARHGGTGLGLAICKQLIHAMGGFMSLKSKLGEGSTFRIEIPHIRMKKGETPQNVPAPKEVAKAQAPQPAPTPSPAQPAAEQEKPLPAPEQTVAATPQAGAITVSAIKEAQSYSTPSPDRTKKPKTRLLLVDDSKMNLMVLKALLKRLGDFDVETAPDGKAAYERLEKKDQPRFDGVLTDMWMPEMDGAGLASVIREHPDLFSMPVYVVTADVELQKDYAEKGFDDIILKPVTIDLLKSKCSNILKG